MKHTIYLKIILISTFILKPILINNFRYVKSKGMFSMPYYEVELYSYVKMLAIYFLILIPFIFFFSILIKKVKKENLEIIGLILNIIIIVLIILSIVIRLRNNL
ncbi:hypothetical protein HP397_06695 [Streptobacillus felis]|uniref:Uncharacterized protein n=1 Tax=Streptobacillus felis TaxID=1384509 RepID=A0A7Z0PGT5_9FUSO|nr:hypothetical protein [Streptobacillus felis]NYV28486.1 hypothetical protein [Streptobacillus felis]